MDAADDPILAVSSPPGHSARGLLRISGEYLRPLIAALFDDPPPRRELNSVRLRLAAAPVDDRTGLALPCLALWTPGPHSYTGQDVLELQVPGNPALLERLVRALTAAMREHLGAGRLAEPGEFTRRAFTAGRIDLTRAEGIAATIGAVSDAQLEAARLLRSGRLGQWAGELVDSLSQSLALAEAGIDFVDQEDVVPIGPAELERALADAERQLDGMLRRSRSWSALESLPWAVLLGPPNAGKSTLFNALLGRDRAVATEIAGTTRDVLAEPLRIECASGEPAELMLADAAGLDAPATAIDEAMQQAVRDAVDRAELLILVTDREGDAPRPPRGDVPAIAVRTKADLKGAATDEGDGGPLPVSGVTGQGLEALRRRIAERLADRAVTVAGQMLALQPRHRDELEAARQAIDDARQQIAPQRDQRQLDGAELVAERMREALDRLAALGGRMSPDDVIGKVFATFCVGK